MISKEKKDAEDTMPGAQERSTAFNTSIRSLDD